MHAWTSGASVRDPESTARTHLANERTFLAWFRTGLTIMALGVAGEQLLVQAGRGSGLVSVMGIIVITAGIAILVLGRTRYVRSRTAIDAGTYRPAGRSIDVSVAVFTAAGIAAVAFIALTSGA
jgi:putative membrane protein